MTLTECIENHKEKWHWIANKTLKQRRKILEFEYFRENNITMPILGSYCCTYDNLTTEYKRDKCKYCPFVKNKPLNPYDKHCFNGLYELWFFELNYIKCAELARAIAECQLSDWAIKKLKTEKKL